jgi:IS1 family transposase
MAVMISGKQLWMWRAVDSEGEVLDLLVQRRRNKAAAVKLMRKLLRKQGFAPEVLVTDKLRSYAAAKSELGLVASKGCAETTELRIRTSPCDGASSRCKDSSRPAQLSAFCLFMPPSTTPSTPSATPHPVTRSASSEARHLTPGERLQRHEPEPSWRASASRLRFP